MRIQVNLLDIGVKQSSCRSAVGLWLCAHPAKQFQRRCSCLSQTHRGVYPHRRRSCQACVSMLLVFNQRVTVMQWQVRVEAACKRWRGSGMQLEGRKAGPCLISTPTLRHISYSYAVSDIFNCRNALHSTIGWLAVVACVLSRSSSPSPWQPTRSTWR